MTLLCGISAISLSAASPNEVARTLEKMNAAQIARGPNGAGVASIGSAGVGMVRLRVRANAQEADPIPLGPQHTAAYNGEVYWSGGGVPAGGAGEVMALTQSEESIADGMYAMALLDHGSQSIDLWRDPFGIKPMWMRKLSNGFAVASTIESLLRGFGSATPRLEGIQQFLAFGRIIDGGSFFEGISSFPRGQRMRLQEGVLTSLSGIEIRQREGTGNQNDAATLRQAVEDSVRRVLPSNQTMGLAISGGLDSTILAHQMAHLGIEDLRTVSVLVDGVEDGISDLSQLQISNPVVCSWSHRAITVTAEGFARGFERAPHELGEPTRLSSVPLYGALADIAQDSGIVVLQIGEGADELFMGYPSYGSVNTDALGFHFDFMVPRARRGYLEALYGSNATAHFQALHKQLFPRPKGVSSLEYLRTTELDHSLEPLLRRADQILMSRSIEGRTPFLHGDVPKLALGIDAAKHMNGSKGKPLLRSAFPELDALDGPWRTKTPFRAPVSRWLQNELGPWMQKTLDDGTAVLRDFGLREDGIRLVRRDAAGGDAAALDMALALVSVVFWCEWLRKERGHGR